MTKFTKVSDRDVKAAAQRGMEIFDEKGSTTWACDEEDFIAAQVECEDDPKPSIVVIDGVEICRECGKQEHSGYCMWA